MSKDWYADIKEFHKVVMCDDFLTVPHIPNSKYQDLRKELIKEEMTETLDALDMLRRGDPSEKYQLNWLGELADGIADSIVVLLGTAVTYGIDLRPIWDKVHAANMAKKDGPMREDGKRLKPVGWTHPDIVEEIRRQQSGK